jgi:CheY-like chemotaxis protein
MRRLCAGILEPVGCQVITANTGREAVESATRDLPQVIIMDVVMPEMDGLEALRQLKQSEPTRSIPVIMISGNVDPQDQGTFTAAGAAGFLTKPFRPAQLLKLVQPLMLGSAAEPEPG